MNRIAPKTRCTWPGCPAPATVTVEDYRRQGGRLVKVASRPFCSGHAAEYERGDERREGQGD